MLSEIFTARGCSTDETICFGAQPICGLQTEEWETDNDQERDWLLNGVNDTEQRDLSEEGRKKCIAAHASLHASHWNWWILSPLCLSLSPFFPLFYSFLSSLVSFPVCLMSFSLCFVSAFASALSPLLLSVFSQVDQRLDLNKLSPNDSDTVRGQIVGEYTSNT